MPERLRVYVVSERDGADLRLRLVSRLTREEIVAALGQARNLTRQLTRALKETAAAEPAKKAAS